MYSIYLFLIFLLKFVASYEVVPLSPKMWVHPYSMHYDHQTNNLYFSDLVDRKIHRFDLNENQDYPATIEHDIAPTFIIPLKGFSDRFVVSDKHTVTIVQWNGKDPIARIVQETFTVETAAKYAENNWNIAKASPHGKFYGGTFRKVTCSSSPGAIAGLYKYTKSKGVKRLAKCLKVSGGIEWNLKENLFYHTDTCNLVIREYDWNPKTGDIENGRIVYKFDNFGDEALFSLGLTIDKKGFLYAPTYYGGEVLKIDPRTSQTVERIKIPAEAVAAVTFAGPNLDILVVSTDKSPFNLTTGGISDRIISPLSGSIFMVKGLGAQGYPGRQLCI